MTPDKLVIPPSGHLDVEIKNPTDNLIKIHCIINSFSFKFERAWILKDRKEIDVDIWDSQKQFTHKMEGHDVLHFKIKCEDTFTIQKSGTYEKSSEFGYLKIKWEVDIYLPSQPLPNYSPNAGFNMHACKTFTLSIEPNCEKAKALADAFSEQQKYQVRRDRVKDCRDWEERDWMREETEEGGSWYDPEKKEKVNNLTMSSRKSKRICGNRLMRRKRKRKGKEREMGKRAS
uniref:C2 tensin-type domain-containing protein n=1 Tax=Caenorhabditis tropicalis TaxID=1561998 RepID=A0A1I7UPJ7_9PELO